MTRDEQRAACIKAMKAGYLGYREPENIGEFFDSFDAAFTAAFDSLHGLARVDPIEATEEMKNSGSTANEKNPEYGLYQRIWRAMSSAGDLTNGPEGKT